MSGSRTKKLREAFERQMGFTPLQRSSEIYKTYWRQFKIAWRKK